MRRIIGDKEESEETSEVIWLSYLTKNQTRSKERKAITERKQAESVPPDELSTWRNLLQPVTMNPNSQPSQTFQRVLARERVILPRFHLGQLALSAIECERCGELTVRNF
eukprot:754774-Hanusia_phi.AAC.1